MTAMITVKNCFISKELRPKFVNLSRSIVAWPGDLLVYQTRAQTSRIAKNLNSVNTGLKRG